MLRQQKRQKMFEEQQQKKDENEYRELFDNNITINLKPVNINSLHLRR
jgi:hypothetical protein